VPTFDVAALISNELHKVTPSNPRSRVNAEAHIRRHTVSGQKPKGKYPSTVAFIVHVNSLPGVDKTPGLPCGLLACFGMDGYSTLIWNRIVRVKYPHLLTNPGFVMAQLIFQKAIPNRPLTSEFATDPAHIEVNLLTQS
jgi:hypothetical protein